MQIGTIGAVMYRHVRLQDVELPAVEHSPFNPRDFPTSTLSKEVDGARRRKIREPRSRERESG
jgi:hypothetical protein